MSERPGATTGSEGAARDGTMGWLRAMSVAAPAAFVSLVIALTAVLVDAVDRALLISLAALVVTAATGLFSGFVFRVIERGEAGLRERNRQLAGLQGATTSLTGAFELGELLQRFVELSRGLTGARYAAMSVLAEDARIEQFITSGITEAERAAIGPPPVGHGLLGVILHEGRALRLDVMSHDPRSVGFPPHHPPMTSLLGVPVVSHGRVIGNLYLTDKEDGAGFTDADEEMVRAFAAHAAVAVETSRLQHELRSLAVLKERERIGMDLHDGIIQAIYAVGLRLEAATEDIAASPGTARASVDTAIEELNAVIRDVRSYIFELRPPHLSEDLRSAIAGLAAQFRVNSLIETTVAGNGDVRPLTDEQQLALFHIAQEALTNARKHARAKAVRIDLSRTGGAVRLAISDDGVGFETSAAPGDAHRGLRNMDTRARSAGGTIAVNSRPGAGTAIEVVVPIMNEGGEAA